MPLDRNHESRHRNHDLTIRAWRLTLLGAGAVIERRESAILSANAESWNHVFFTGHSGDRLLREPEPCIHPEDGKIAWKDCGYVDCAKDMLKC